MGRSDSISLFMMPSHKPIRVLFVCLGNICRSPSAEIIFKHLVSRQNLSSQIISDSAGIIEYHRGSSPDARMLTALKNFGYTDPGLKARPVTFRDLSDFDYIIPMDYQNLRDLSDMDSRGRYAEKFLPMCNFTESFTDTEVPDPYYGGTDGFNHVVELLEETCANLLEFIKSKHSLS